MDQYYIHGILLISSDGRSTRMHWNSPTLTARPSGQEVSFLFSTTMRLCGTSRMIDMGPGTRPCAMYY